MISIYSLKPAFQNLLRPIANWLASCGISANMITISAIFISLATGCAITLFPLSPWPLLILPLILLVRMILNALDGMLAREHNMQSALGAFLNELGDVVSDLFLYLPFAWLPGISAKLIFLIVLLSIISEMTGVIAVQVGAARRYDGPMGKSDRAFVFSVFGVAMGLQLITGNQANILFSFVVIALFVTIAKRINNAIKEVQPLTRSP